ncbi:MAG: hypothetical protein FJZ67_08270, partial [Bacteroidetes bacterium]|nr:hypothetical protein [Bacteroidota bacterium]
MERLIKGTLFFLILFYLVCSCSKKSVFIPTGKPLETAHFAAKIGPTPESDSYEIKNVLIDANFLYVTVQYDGSCSGKDV